MNPRLPGAKTPAASRAAGSLFPEGKPRVINLAGRSQRNEDFLRFNTRATSIPAGCVNRLQQR